MSEGSNKKKRILIFSTAYYPYVGGAEVAIKEITDRLNGFEFDIITARFDRKLPKKEKIGNVNVYRVGIGRSFFDKLFLPFSGASLALRLHREREYFCLWAVMVTFGSLAAYIFNVLRWFGGGGKVPIVLTLQEGDSEAHLKYKWAGLISLSWKIAMRKTDFLTAISNFLLQRAKNNGFKGPSALVPNGVNFNLFSKEIDENTKNDLREKLSKKPGDIFLVTSSRLTYKNAVDDIIASLSSLPENISLLIIGKGDLGSDLQKKADKLDLSKRVKFLGFIPYESIPEYFSISDIFIRPSRSEGFGNSFIEAMAAKLPVIATPVGGIVDFISDKETGVFCYPDNPQSIVRTVNMLLSDSSLKEYIVKNAYELVSKKYRWDDVAILMKEVFDRLPSINNIRV
jgi:glycosyltransferase involved in cell wall biosynthesis